MRHSQPLKTVHLIWRHVDKNRIPAAPLTLKLLRHGVHAVVKAGKRRQTTSTRERVVIVRAPCGGVRRGARLLNVQYLHNLILERYLVLTLTLPICPKLNTILTRSR